jgi:hypothetical protein
MMEAELLKSVEGESSKFVPMNEETMERIAQVDCERAVAERCARDEPYRKMCTMAAEMGVPRHQLFDSVESEWHTKATRIQVDVKSRFISILAPLGSLITNASHIREAVQAKCFLDRFGARESDLVGKFARRELVPAELLDPVERDHLEQRVAEFMNSTVAAEMNAAVLEESIKERRDEADRRKAAADRRKDRDEQRKELAQTIAAELGDRATPDQQGALAELAADRVRIDEPGQDDDPRDQLSSVEGLDTLLDHTSEDFQRLKTVYVALSNATHIMAGFEDESYCAGTSYFLLWLQLRKLITSELPGAYFLEARRRMLDYMEKQEQKNRLQFVQLLAVALLSPDQRVDDHEAEIRPADIQAAFDLIERSMPEPKVELDIDLVAGVDLPTQKYGKALTTARGGINFAPKTSSRVQQIARFKQARSDESWSGVWGKQHPLAFWEQATTMPELASFAQIEIPKMRSSCPLEREMSRLSWAFGRYRHRLSEESINALMCIGSNLPFLRSRWGMTSSIELSDHVAAVIRPVDAMLTSRRNFLAKSMLRSIRNGQTDTAQRDRDFLRRVLRSGSESEAPA